MKITLEIKPEGVLALAVSVRVDGDAIDTERRCY
jgi:hypothetical protein